MILDVGRIRVTFVAIRTLYTTYTAQMTYVIIEIFPPFEPLPASIAVQIVAVEIRIRIFHATNLVFLFARVPHVERQISLLGERLAALRTLYSVRPCTGRRVFPFWKLKTQTRYVEQTFSRASIPSRLSKVKGGGGGGSGRYFVPPFDLYAVPRYVYIRIRARVYDIIVYDTCVCVCVHVYVSGKWEKKNIDFRRLKRRYIIYKRLFTQVTPKSRQGNTKETMDKIFSLLWNPDGRRDFLAHTLPSTHSHVNENYVLVPIQPDTTWRYYLELKKKKKKNRTIKLRR